MSVKSDSLRPYGPPGSSIHGILQARIWSGLPCPPPGDLLNVGIKTDSLELPALADGFFITGTTWEALTVPLGAITTMEICHVLDNFRLQIV